MYIVLSGARQNSGDFLIGARCKALLDKHKPGEELIQFDSATPLLEHLELVNQSKGIIVMGGPGYRPEMYPGIYTLTPDLADIKVPIVLLGMGWKGENAELSTVKKYSFSSESLGLLKKSLDRDGGYLSCRDYYTWKILKDHGLNNVLMTGCPAWYELDSLYTEYKPPEKLEQIVYTPPAQPKYREQAIRVAETLKELFPNATIMSFFHHGFSYHGKSGNEDFFHNQRMMRDEFDSLGIASVDVSGSVSGMSKYRAIDLHVGYRVHAHIDCLSRRRTSILIHEDGRGAGVDDALGIPGINAWKAQAVTPKKNLVERLRGHISCRMNYIANDQVSNQLKNLIERECDHGFSSFFGIDKKLDNYYKVMSRFIESF